VSFENDFLNIFVAVYPVQGVNEGTLLESEMLIKTRLIQDFCLLQRSWDINMRTPDVKLL
jgi:hypothetical protein